LHAVDIAEKRIRTGGGVVVASVMEERANPGGSIVAAPAVALQGRFPGGRVTDAGGIDKKRLKTGGGVFTAQIILVES
jgi:hypothetical protein